MQFTKTKRKLDFIIAGTQKGGTTALDHYLRLHPEIGMANEKEVHFFDNESYFKNSKVKYSKYHKNFDFKTDRKIYGEATPIYMYWEPSCKRIWEYNSDIKLIVMLRNPVKRAFSHWNMEFDRNADKETFSFAIRNEKQRVKTALPLQHRVYSYTDRGFYSEQIRRIRRFFPDVNLLFVKYEEFNENQEETLLKIFSFLGVNPDNFNFERKTVHKRKKHSEISLKDKEYLIEIFKHDIHQVEHMLNWDCNDWLE